MEKIYLNISWYVYCVDIINLMMIFMYWYYFKFLYWCFEGYVYKIFEGIIKINLIGIIWY